MNKQRKAQLKMIFVLGVFMLGMGMIAMPVGAVTNNLASKMELSVPLTDMYVYNSNYKTDDVLASGLTFDASPIPGFTLLKTYTSLSLSGTTFESDNVQLGSTGLNLFDRPVYSTTFLNETYNTPVESNATATTTSNVAISDNGVTGTFSVANDAVAASNNAYGISNLAIDGNGDGDYTDAGDYAYLPLSVNGLWILVNVMSDFSATPNAADYGLLSLIFERTTGTDYTINIKEWATTGNSGWDLTTSNGATFNAYDSDASYVVLSIPLQTLYTEDGESGTILGLDQIKWTGLVAGASDSVAMTAKNIALFSSQPALTDRTDDDNNFDYNDAGGIAAGVAVADSDFINTKITEGTTESYDNTMALNKDLSGTVSTLMTIRKATFTGTATIQPTSATSTSSLVSGASYYYTSESVVFDTTAINDIKTFSNIFVWGNVQLNITIDDSVFPFTTDYGDNLYSFSIDHIDLKATYVTAWSATGVSGSSSPKSEVQYDYAESTTTGVYSTVSLGIFTKTPYNVQLTTTESAPVTSVVGGGGPPTTEVSSSNSLMMVGIVVVLLGGVTVVALYRKKGMKPKRKRKH